MKYSNELKVGATILVAAAILILGVRYFQDLPLFRTTVDYETHFEDAKGLISGNVVRVQGVTVGSVKAVWIDPTIKRVRVRFHIDRAVVLPEGTTTYVSGVEALGVTQMEIDLGSADNPLIPPGSMVPSSRGMGDLLGDLTDRAPIMIDRVDSVLIGLSATVGGAQALLADPNSNLQQSLVAMRSSMQALNTLIRTEQGRIASVLTNVDELTGTLGTVATGTGDSLSVAMARLNQTLGTLDQNLVSFQQTTDRLDAILLKIEQGEGTLGLMINDPSVYQRLDSTLASVNLLLADFKAHPRRYLKELDLVDIF